LAQKANPSPGQASEISIPGGIGRKKAQKAQKQTIQQRGDAGAAVSPERRPRPAGDQRDFIQIPSMTPWAGLSSSGRLRDPLDRQRGSDVSVGGEIPFPF
jgi:hypothetical protein